MKVFLKRRNSVVDAIGEYNMQTKECIVLKGSIVSDKIAYSEKFRGAASIEKSREGKIKNSKVVEDVLFKSASTAANFVTGASTNGLVAWKDENGKSLKELIKGDKDE